MAGFRKGVGGEKKEGEGEGGWGPCDGIWMMDEKGNDG